MLSGRVRFSNRRSLLSQVRFCPTAPVQSDWAEFTIPPDPPEMVHNQSQTYYRSEEAMKGVEAQQSGFGNLWSAQEDLLQFRADQRHPAQELGHYLGRPNGLRVPTQDDVAGKIEPKVVRKRITPISQLVCGGAGKPAPQLRVRYAAAEPRASVAAQKCRERMSGPKGIT